MAAHGCTWLQDAPNSARLGIEEHLALTCADAWVSVPQALLLHYLGRTFEVRARVCIAHT